MTFFEMLLGSGGIGMQAADYQAQAAFALAPAKGPFSQNFWIEKRCSRCGGKYFKHALQNVAMCAIPETECDFCLGHISASEQEYRNLAIESETP